MKNPFICGYWKLHNADSTVFGR